MNPQHFNVLTSLWFKIVVKDVFIPGFIGNRVSHIVLYASRYEKRGKLRKCYLFSSLSGRNQVWPLF